MKATLLKFVLSWTNKTGDALTKHDRQKIEEVAYQSYPDRQKRFIANLRDYLIDAGLHSGRILEIGGRRNPLAHHFPDFECINLDIENTNEDTIVGDITNCPEIESESFDAIVSFDVFEHVDRPWKAAEEIIRLLKPGGLTYHSTLWSWRYHPCPIDYWRFSPDALEFLFDGLETVVKEFDMVERRRNILGQGQYKLKSDAFGGWRENWRVHYAGKKNRI